MAEKVQMKILNYVKENSFLFVYSKSNVSSSYYTPLLLLNATTEPPFVKISEELVTLRLYDFLINNNVLLSFIAC